MINILLLEDSQLKAKMIATCIKGSGQLTDENITVSSDIVTAKRLLVDNQYDLLLLDIQLPVRFQQTPKVDAGISFLKELSVSKKMNLPYHIIGITAYEDAFLKADKVFADMIWTVLRYSESSMTWQNQLLHKIEYLIRSKSCMRNLSPRSYEYDLGIVTALDTVELESILKLEANWKKIKFPIDGTYYHSGVFEKDGKSVSVVAASAAQMGMVSATTLTMKMIGHFSPRYIAMAGITAGVKGKVELGDVLIADKSWDYGSGKFEMIDGKPRFSPASEPLRLDADIKGHFNSMKSNDELLNKIRSDWPADKPRNGLEIVIGPVASGASVLANPEIVQSIKDQDRKLVGVEMETYGVFFAALNSLKPRPIVFSVKSVCDFADAEKADSYQRYSAYTSANVLYHFALDYLCD